MNSVILREVFSGRISRILFIVVGIAFLAVSCSKDPVTPTPPGHTDTKPGAPTISAVSVDVNAATVTFAPTTSGSSAITSYTVSVSPGDKVVSGNGSPITISGLATGTKYVFTVTATNSVGTSDASKASDSIRVLNDHSKWLVTHSPFVQKTTFVFQGGTWLDYGTNLSLSTTGYTFYSSYLYGINVMPGNPDYTTPAAIADIQSKRTAWYLNDQDTFTFTADSRVKNQTLAIIDDNTFEYRMMSPVFVGNTIIRYDSVRSVYKHY